MNVQHSNGKANWGTPVTGAELARGVLGAIDLDPASDGFWNYWTIKATTFYDQQTDGLKQAWRGRVFLNPPGKTDDNPGGPGPREFWEKLVEEYTAGNVTSAVYLGFSLEQACQLQACAVHPLQFVTLVPMNRMRFLERPHMHYCPALTQVKPTRKKGDPKAPDPCTCGRQDNGPPIEGDSPTHGNFITLLHDQTTPGLGAKQLGALVDWGSSLEGVPGAIVRPH